MPGLPGKPGGIFFGIEGIVISGNQLIISANGGNGVIDQDGGSGHGGKFGRSPPDSD